MRREKARKDKESLIKKQNEFILKLERTPSEVFKDNSPESLKQAIESVGLKTTPLGRGRLKGIPFENGGGYRAHYGGDGYIQYHPDIGGHHKGAYYKISCGKYGTRRFKLNGEKIDE